MMSQIEDIYCKWFELNLTKLLWWQPEQGYKEPNSSSKTAKTHGQVFWSPDSLLWCCSLCSALSTLIPWASSNGYGSNGTHVLDPSVRIRVLPLRLLGLGCLSSLVCLLGLLFLSHSWNVARIKATEATVVHGGAVALFSTSNASGRLSSVGKSQFQSMRLDKELTSCAHLLFEHYMDAIFGRQENHRLLGTIQF